MLLCRYQRFKFSVSGSSPVTGTAGVENVDLSAIVHQVRPLCAVTLQRALTAAQHVDYCRKMKDILRLVDLAGCRSTAGEVSTGSGPQQP